MVGAVVVVAPVAVVVVVVAGRRGRDLLADRGQDLQHGPEPQLGGLADQLQGPVLVIDTGELHQDRVCPGG